MLPPVETLGVPPVGFGTPPVEFGVPPVGLGFPPTEFVPPTFVVPPLLPVVPPVVTLVSPALPSGAPEVDPESHPIATAAISRDLDPIPDINEACRFVMAKNSVSAEHPNSRSTAESFS